MNTIIRSTITKRLSIYFLLGVVLAGLSVTSQGGIVKSQRASKSHSTAISALSSNHELLVADDGQESHGGKGGGGKSHG